LSFFMSSPGVATQFDKGCYEFLGEIIYFLDPGWVMILMTSLCLML
jgi:hypothetical protein